MEKINDTGVISFAVGEETIQLRFGIPANRMLFSRWVNVPDFGANINEADVAWLLYAGYVNACMAKNIEAVKTFEFFYDTVENYAYTEEGKKVLSDIGECYANSRHTKNYTDDVKKKTAEIVARTGISSNPTVMENSDSNQTNTTD